MAAGISGRQCACLLWRAALLLALLCFSGTRGDPEYAPPEDASGLIEGQNNTNSDRLATAPAGQAAPAASPATEASQCGGSPCAAGDAPASASAGGGGSQLGPDGPAAAAAEPPSNAGSTPFIGEAAESSVMGQQQDVGGQEAAALRAPAEPLQAAAALATEQQQVIDAAAEQQAATSSLGEQQAAAAAVAGDEQAAAAATAVAEQQAAAVVAAEQQAAAATAAAEEQAAVLHQEQQHNFALSKDGAKVLATNKEAKKPNALLDDDSDTFLKNDCKADKWVLVELSQVAKVSRLELAQFELYSARVKEFAVHGRQTHPRTDGVGLEYARSLNSTQWKLLGNFTAEKAKGTQVFSFEQPRWVRFLLLRFLTQHGPETVCAMNGIAVFGKSAVEELEDQLASEEGLGYLHAGLEPAAEAVAMAAPAPVAPPPAVVGGDVPPAAEPVAAGQAAVARDGSSLPAPGQAQQQQQLEPQAGQAEQQQPPAAEASSTPAGNASEAAAAFAAAAAARLNGMAAAPSPEQSAAHTPGSGTSSSGISSQAAGGAVVDISGLNGTTGQQIREGASGDGSSPAAMIVEQQPVSSSVAPAPVPSAPFSNASGAGAAAAAGAAVGNASVDVTPAQPQASAGGASGASVATGTAVPAGTAVAAPEATAAAAGPQQAPSAAQPAISSSPVPAAAAAAPPPAAPAADGADELKLPLAGLTVKGKGGSSVYDILVQEIKGAKLQQKLLARSLAELQRNASTQHAELAGDVASLAAEVSKLQAEQSLTDEQLAARVDVLVTAHLLHLSNQVQGLQAALASSAKQQHALLCFLAMMGGVLALSSTRLADQWPRAKWGVLLLAVANGLVGVALQLQGGMAWQPYPLQALPSWAAH